MSQSIHPKTKFKGRPPFPKELLDQRLATLAYLAARKQPLWNAPLPGDDWQEQTALDDSDDDYEDWE